MPNMRECIMDDNTAKKVIIQSGCITCGVCEFVAPDVFEVTDVSHVKKNISYKKYKDQIDQAVAQCPVNVIQYCEDV